MNVLSTAWLVARKDLRLFFRDRTGMMLGFLLPIVLITVFGFIMKYAFRTEGGMPQATLWVADEDHSPQSQKLVETLSESEMLNVRLKRDERPVDAAAIRGLIEEGEAHHGLIISSGFGRDVSAGELPKVKMLRDPGRELEDQVIQIALVQSFMAASEGKMWPAAMGKMMREAGMNDAEAEGMIAAARKMNQLIARFVEKRMAEDSPSKSPPQQTGPGGPAENDPATESEQDSDRLAFELGDIMQSMIPIENEDLQPPGRPRMMTYMLARSVAGTTVMMLMFGVMGCSTMLLREREEGTLPRLFTAAMPRSGVYWGKFLFTAIIGMIQLAVLFVFGNLLFQIGAFRDPATLIVLSVTWAAAATAFAMLIAAWARTAKQAEGISTILILVFAAAGGCWFPLQLMKLPKLAEMATRFSLAYWPMEGYHGMFYNALPWTHWRMLTAVGVQWAFVVLAAVAAQILYHRRYVAG